MSGTHRCMGFKDAVPKKNECTFSNWKAGVWTTAIPIGALLGPDLDNNKKDRFWVLGVKAGLLSVRSVSCTQIWFRSEGSNNETRL